jgi:hypothetical protein
MTDLFDHAMQEHMKSEAPLAARMRPRVLEEYIGQEHIIGESKLLRRAIEADRLFSSILLWGPPGRLMYIFPLPTQFLATLRSFHLHFSYPLPTAAVPGDDQIK